MSAAAKPRVVVAMSGGVDSSVAAALLVEQGYEVVGMMLRLWSEPGTELFNRCCTPEAMALARRVAAHLEIPFYAVDVRETFHQEIVRYFIDGYAQGGTPNPCMMCNRHIRFGALLQQALSLDAAFLATGHYARLDRTGETIRLFRGVDRDKDQSYVLSVLSQQQLRHALFPVGAYPKPQVREFARRFNLPTAERQDSQDLCFLAGGNYRDFLLRHAPEVHSPGEIVDPDGRLLGEHQGLAFYTIGQRKGLGVTGPQPLYVIDKLGEANRLVVGPKEALGKTSLFADGAGWISGSPPEAGLRAAVQIRYTARELSASIYPEGPHAFRAVFDEPVRDITPGQAAVVFRDDEVLGQATIRSAEQTR